MITSKDLLLKAFILDAGGVISFLKTAVMPEIDENFLETTSAIELLKMIYSSYFIEFDKLREKIVDDEFQLLGIKYVFERLYTTLFFSTDEVIESGTKIEFSIAFTQINRGPNVDNMAELSQS